MTQLEKMYEGKINSPETFLRDRLVSGGSVVYLMDDSILPTLPNLLVIGKDQTAETVLVTGKRSDGGYDIQRAIQGTAKDWPQGTSCARNFTEYDYDKLVKNIEKLNSEKQEGLTAGSNITIKNNKISATDTVYTHPDKHKPSEIDTNENNRFVTDEEKRTWNAKLDSVSGEDISKGKTKGYASATAWQSVGNQRNLEDWIGDFDKRTKENRDNKQEKLTAGANITIDSDNKISAAVPTINYPVKSVNSKTGAVTITKSDLGLGMVQNIGIYILSEAQYNALSSTEKNRKDKLYGTY